MKLSQKQLRKLIVEIAEEHPLSSDDDGLTPATKGLIEQLAMQVCEDIAEVEDIDPGEIFPDAQRAISTAITEFYDAFYMR